MIDRAVDHAWRDRLEDAEIAITALGLALEPAQEAEGVDETPRER
jgi:hypothetical protein